MSLCSDSVEIAGAVGELGRGACVPLPAGTGQVVLPSDDEHHAQVAHYRGVRLHGPAGLLAQVGPRRGNLALGGLVVGADGALAGVDHGLAVVLGLRGDYVDRGVNNVLPLGPALQQNFDGGLVAEPDLGQLGYCLLRVEPPDRAALEHPSGGQPLAFAQGAGVGDHPVTDLANQAAGLHQQDVGGVVSPPLLGDIDEQGLVPDEDGRRCKTVADKAIVPVRHHHGLQPLDRPGPRHGLLTEVEQVRAGAAVVGAGGARRVHPRSLSKMFTTEYPIVYHK